MEFLMISMCKYKDAWFGWQVRPNSDPSYPTRTPCVAMEVRASTKRWLGYWDNNSAIPAARRTFAEDEGSGLSPERKRRSVFGRFLFCTIRQLFGTWFNLSICLPTEKCLRGNVRGTHRSAAN